MCASFLFWFRFFSARNYRPKGNVQPVSPTGKTRFFVTYSTDRVIRMFYYIVGIQLSKGEKISIANKQASNSFLLAFWIVVVFIRQIYLVTSSLSKHERNSYRKFFIGKKSNMRRSVSSLRRESKIRRAAEYFRRTSRVPSPDEKLCRTLDSTSQTKGFYQEKLRMQVFSLWIIDEYWESQIIDQTKLLNLTDHSAHINCEIWPSLETFFSVCRRHFIATNFY